MKIAKLHKPQRMGNWKNVLAYSSEEEEDPDALADAEAAANADSTSSTGVQITERGVSTTSQDSTGRITFSINSPVWVETAADSTARDSLRISLSGPGAAIDIAIPLPESGSATPQPDYIMPGDVEYDQYGRKLVH